MLARQKIMLDTSNFNLFIQTYDEGYFRRNVKLIRLRKQNFFYIAISAKNLFHIVFIGGNFVENLFIR